MNVTRKVHKHLFKAWLAMARLSSKQVKVNVCSLVELANMDIDSAYLSKDCQSGYAVTTDGELVGLFSLVRGRGKALILESILNGVTHLNCFDGVLTELYAIQGFVEVARKKNYIEGKPDVVYMKLGERV